jgi:hypothetical protein
MDTVTVVREAAAIPDVLVLDGAAGCSLCRPEDTAAAHATLGGLCRWWLGPEQRDAWRADTLIECKRRPDGTACDAVFKVAAPGPPGLLPIFCVLSQHWEGKRLPHYQLQIPYLPAAAGAWRGTDAEPQIAALAAGADRGVEGLRQSHRSISLHAPLGVTGEAVVREAIGGYVVGLRDLLWAGAV